MRAWPTCFLVALLAVDAAGAGAQAQSEVEVYRSDVAPRRTLLFELHTNYTFRGAVLTGTGAPDDDLRKISPLSFDPVCNDSSTPAIARMPWKASASFVQSSQPGAIGCGLNSGDAASHTLRETLELVSGVTSWSEVAVYAFASKHGSDGAKWAGSTLRAKVRVPAEWRWPVGFALSTEVEYERSFNSIGSWSLEIRPVIDKTAGRWYLSLNPTIAKRLRGPGISGGATFSPSGKISFDATSMITAGVEYYGAYGAFGNFAAADSRLQQLYGAVDLHVSPMWEINFGVGFGLTPGTNPLAAKLILGRAFRW